MPSVYIDIIAPSNIIEHLHKITDKLNIVFDQFSWFWSQIYDLQYRTILGS